MRVMPLIDLAVDAPVIDGYAFVDLELAEGPRKDCPSHSMSSAWQKHFVDRVPPSPWFPDRRQGTVGAWKICPSMETWTRWGNRRPRVDVDTCRGGHALRLHMGGRKAPAATCRGNPGDAARTTLGMVIRILAGWMLSVVSGLSLSS